MHVVNRLLGRWDELCIRYTHFKSNMNLDYSFNDNGDFDILVDPARAKDATLALIELDAKQTNTITEKHYPGVDNWLLYDDESGRIHHLHLHYQIMSGKQYVKDYEIPLTELVLNTRIFNAKWNIYISNPEVELIILSIRLVIKSHFSDNLRAMMGIYKTNKSLQKEREGLLSIVASNNLENYLSCVFNPEDVSSVKKIIMSKKISSSGYKKLSYVVRRMMHSYRRMSAMKASFLSMKGTFHYYWLSGIKKIGAFCISKKTPMTKGMIIAFVGVDGSGKSTTEKRKNSIEIRTAVWTSPRSGPQILIHGIFAVYSL